MSDYRAYYQRYKTAYLARFCNAGDARAWLEHGENFEYLAPDGTEPEPGVEYRDIGHQFCLAPNCPKAERTGE